MVKKPWFMQLKRFALGDSILFGFGVVFFLIN